MLYLRSVIANKFTLFGYVNATLACFALCAELAFDVRQHLSVDMSVVTRLIFIEAALFLVAAPLVLTAFGLETHSACRRTLRMFAMDGGRSERFRHRMWGTYCARVGFLLAVRVWDERCAREGRCSTLDV
ncbi:MAG TPA: hypothetical protein VJB97_03180 [Candidatus Paceibacterota bacterium]